MKLHDPETEYTLIQLAIQARQGREMSPPDGPGWFRRMLNKCGGLLMLPIALPYLNSFPVELRSQPWQNLVYSVILMWSALHIGRRLDDLSTSPNTFPALVNLPITGEKALCWIRYRALLETGFVTLVLCFLISIALHGFASDSRRDMAATALLFFAIVFATALLGRDAWVQRSRLPKVWGIVTLLTVIGAVLILFTEKKAFLNGGMPEWMQGTLSKMCWIFPPSWVMPGHLEGVGGYLASGWIAWGLGWWVMWPKVFAPMFDSPDVFFDGINLEQAEPRDDEEPQESDRHVADSSAPLSLESIDVKTDQAQTGIYPLPGPLALLQNGWVESWILRGLSEQDRHLLGIMIHPQQTWTRRTHRVLSLVPVCLFSAWIFMCFFPKGELWEVIYIWGYILSMALITLGLLPFSNAIPRATEWWSLGSQTLPFFSALPLSARDLLRVSMRITWVRSLVMIAIVCPYSLALSAILKHERMPWLALWLVPAAGLLWVLSRPVFLWYRLQAMSKRQRGVSVWVWHVITSTLIVALGFGWLSLAMIGIFAAIAIFQAETPIAWWSQMLLCTACLCGSGLCARLIFEMYHWRLRRGHIDWLSTPPRTS